MYLCDPEYINLVFEIIRKKTKNKNFIEFLDYFEEQYMIKWNINNWNYYHDQTHCTNNSCESYNCKLNRMFNCKPSFFKLLYELRIEEKEIQNTYKKRKMGLLGKEIRRRTTIEKKLALLKDNIKNIGELPDEDDEQKNIKADAWFKCLNLLGRGLLN